MTDPITALQLVQQFGPATGVAVLLVLVLVRNRDRVNSLRDESIESIVSRLDGEVVELREQLRTERVEREADRDRAQARQAAQEALNADHRRWDSLMLRTALSGGDVGLLPNPPSLTPHPSTYDPAWSSPDAGRPGAAAGGGTA